MYSTTVQVTGLQPIAGANLQPRADLQQIVARSSYLSPKNSVQVVGQGALVVLRGTAVSAYERQLIEAMLRLSPGVDNVRNEITIAAAGTTPGSP
jgi:hypothetical protein